MWWKNSQFKFYVMEKILNYTTTKDEILANISPSWLQWTVHRITNRWHIRYISLNSIQACFTTELSIRLTKIMSSIKEGLQQFRLNMDYLCIVWDLNKIFSFLFFEEIFTTYVFLTYRYGILYRSRLKNEGRNNSILSC